MSKGIFIILSSSERPTKDCPDLFKFWHPRNPNGICITYIYFLSKSSQQNKKEMPNREDLFVGCLNATFIVLLFVL